MKWWQIGVIVWGLFLAAFIWIGYLRYKRVTEREHQEYVAKHGWWRWRWTQDGWMRKCKICGVVQYGGDDYDGGPDQAGPIE